MSTVSASLFGVIDDRAISLEHAFEMLRSSGEFQAIVRTIVKQSIIQREARELELVATDEELQQRADALRHVLGLQHVDDTHSWLAQQYMSIDDFERMLEVDVWRRKLSDVITGPRVENYFQQHRADFDAANLSQIVVNDEGLALELHSQIMEEGDDFGALARRFSRDEATASSGGRVGRVLRSKMPEELASKVFAATAGDVIGPLAIGTKQHLIRIDELITGELDEATRREIQSLLFEQWLESRVQESAIKVQCLDETTSK